MILGNKCDLESLREVELKEAEALCSYLPEVLHVVETSAKDNVNIDTIFFCIASELKVNHSMVYLSFFSNLMYQFIIIKLEIPESS